MKITCDLAIDLADVYTSGKASEETKNAVEEHIKTCSSCREYYDGFKGEEKKGRLTKQMPNIRLEASGVDEELISRSLTRLSKRLHTRRVITTACAIITAVFGLSSILYDLINDYKKGN